MTLIERPQTWESPRTGKTRLIVLSMGWANSSIIVLQQLLAACPELAGVGDWLAVDHLADGYDLKREADAVREYATKHDYTEIAVVGASMGAGLLPVLEDYSRLTVGTAVLIDPVLTTRSLRPSRRVMALAAYLTAYMGQDFWRKLSRSAPDIEPDAKEGARAHREFGIKLYGGARRSQSAALLRFGRVSGFANHHRSTYVTMLTSEHDDAVRANYNAGFLRGIYYPNYIGRTTVVGTWHTSLVEHRVKWGTAILAEFRDLMFF